MCLVADDGGKLTGFAILNPYSRPPVHARLHLKELYVTAAARSAGVGEKLIEGIRALAKERGDTRVLWTTTEDNIGAQRLMPPGHATREKGLLRDGRVS